MQPSSIKSTKKRPPVFLWILILVFLLLATLTIIPPVLSTKTGTGWLVNYMNHKIEGKLSIDHLSLSLWNTQSIQGIRMIDPHQKPLLNCSEIKSDSPLWKILFFHEIGLCTLSHPEFYIRNDSPPTATVIPEYHFQKASLVPTLQIGMIPIRKWIHNITGKCEIIDGKIEVLSLNADPISFSNIQSLIHIPKTEHFITAKLSCATNNGSVQMDAELKSLDRETPSISLTTHLFQLPIQGIDQIISQFSPQFNGILLNAIGSSITMDLQASFDANTFKVSLDATSPQLNASLSAEAKDAWIRLQKPSYISMTLTPLFIQKAAQILPFLCEISLEAPETIQFALKEFSIPILKQKADLSSMTLKGELTSSKNISMKAFEMPFILESLNMGLAVSKGHLVIELISHLSLSNSSLNQYLGSSLDLDCSMDVTALEKRVRITANAPLFQLPSLDLSIAETIKLKAPAQFTYLLEPNPIECTLSQLELALSSKNQKTKIDGDASISSLSIGAISFQNMQIPFHIDPYKKTASLQISSQVQNEKTSQLNILATISNLTGFDLNPSSIQISCDGQHIPSNLCGVNYAPLIGPSFNFAIKGKSTPTEQALSVKTASPLISIDTSLHIDQTAAQIENAQVNWTLTPDGYLFLDRLEKRFFQLMQPTTFSIDFSKLRIPLASQRNRIPQMSNDLLQLFLVGTVKNNDIYLLDQTSQEEIHLSNLNFSLNKTDATSPISLAVSTNVSSKSAQEKTGSLNLNGTISHLFNAKNELDLSAISSEIQLKIAKFPSCILNLFARINGVSSSPFSIIFGDTINASISSSLQNFSGPLTLNLNSPNAKASLIGNLKAGALVLDQSIYVQAKITPEISRLFLKELNPLDISYIYSQDPITLEIPSQNFYLPLHPFDMAKINIPKARIELGKIYCGNEGNIKITLGLLKAQGFEKDIKLWFAPLDLNVSQGTLKLERTEILLSDTFDIAIWGEIDLLKHYVDMILGLTAQSLYQAFGISGLPENYVLTIPMKGPANDVHINTGKATAKIALLLAWQQKVISGAIGGTAGALVEGLLGKLATLPDQNAKIPAAKRPFPWEVEGSVKKKKTSDAPSGKKKHFKSQENPIKQLIKILSLKTAVRDGKVMQDFEPEPLSI